MSYSTLYFYKLPINLFNKNFILENIETYLATLTPVTKTEFQYQRAELEKTIKVNMSQNYQLNLNSLVKYNYLKIVMDNAIYYYIIKSAKQVSESTIEFNIVMDVLNTFTFSQTASNRTYTLNKKSLITREHKDRLVKLPTQYVLRDLTSEEKFAFSELDSNNYYQNTSETEVHLLLNFSNAIDYLKDVGESSILFTFNTTNSYIVIKKENSSSVDTYENISTISIDDNKNVVITLQNSSIRLIHLGNNDLFIIVIPVDGALSFNFVSYVGDWTEFMNLAINTDKSISIEENKYKRIIDYYQEGLSTILFKKSEETLFDEDEDNQWYILYTSQNAVQSASVDYASKFVNPVEVRFYSDKGYTINTSSSREVTLNATSPLIPKWDSTPEEIEYIQDTPSTLGEKYVKIGGVTYDLHDYSRVYLERQNNSDLTFRIVTITQRNPLQTISFMNVGSVTFYGINTLNVSGMWGNSGVININSGASSYTGTADKWEDLDLTDSRYLKAFAFPYCPCDFMVGKTNFDILPAPFSFNADDYIQLNNVQKYEFKYQKNFKVASPLSNININIDTIDYGMARNSDYESKLFHSDYYLPKFVYDSFSFMFMLEHVNVDSVNESFMDLENNFYCTYVVSRNVQSKFMFIFNEYVLNRSTQDYDNILTIERNNEKALFNNEYINYIRSGGYNYDTKKANSQNAVNGMTTALSVVGAVGSFAGGIATQNPMYAMAGVGLAVATATSVIRAVHTAQEQDRAIAQKINQANMQGTSVQGNEDIDILTAFSGNKAKLVYYELSERMKNAMWDLFHYCGYATHEQKIPNVSSRIYFNFVQGEIILQDYTFNDTIALSIIQKWKDGVTFMHLVNSSYDFEQQYENFETSLI